MAHDRGDRAMGSKKRRTPRRSLAFSQKKRFPVAELARERATLRKEYLSKSKELSALRKKLERLQKNGEKIRECVDQLELEVTPPTQSRATAFEILQNTSTSRKKSPTELTGEGKLNLLRRSAHRRQLETLIAASEVNGGSVEDRTPALDGMFSTVLKYGKMADISKYFDSSKKLKRAAAMKINAQAKEYEESNENFIRSLSLLYAGGIIGKVKYQQGRSAMVMRHTGKRTMKGYLSRERIKFGFGVPIPRPLAYSALMHKIEEINVGETLSVRETLCTTLPRDQRVDGVYRDLETMLIMLSQFYFETNEFRKDNDKLNWFGHKEGSFKVAIGGDGAPFGKWDESMSWLVSFLNVGPRVASPNDNFLLFGANCKEDHPCVEQFTLQLTSKIEAIEKKTYTVSEKQVTFTFELVPSDMKFLAFLNGELNNAATYFSSFANVSKEDCVTLNGKFGLMNDCKWKPWPYKDRLNIAKQVESFKAKLPSSLAASTKRTKITKFIASNKSRQEFQPLIGKLCDKEVVEPLHLKNNGVQHLHTMLLNLAISSSNLPQKISSLSDLSPACAMSRYMKALECDVKAGRLKKQLGKWMLEDRSKDKDFSYRLTGKDSRLILHGFMYLVNAIRGDSDDPKLLMKLLFIVFIAMKLRDCASIFSMYHITQPAIDELKVLARDYFTAVTLFTGTVSGTVWSIGHLVPVHTQWVFEKYETGLGVNTMQGREAKHVQIASYARNSLYKDRWNQVFRHDYISKLWLPLRQPSLLTYHQSRDSLIPNRITTDAQHFCSCGFSKGEHDDKCFFCGHKFMDEIKKSVAEGKPTRECLKYLS